MSIWVPEYDDFLKLEEKPYSDEEYDKLVSKDGRWLTYLYVESLNVTMEVTVDVNWDSQEDCYMFGHFCVHSIISGTDSDGDILGMEIVKLCQGILDRDDKTFPYTLTGKIKRDIVDEDEEDCISYKLEEGEYGNKILE